MRWPGSLAQWRSGEFTRVQQTGVVQCSGLQLYTVLFDPLALVPAQARAAVQCQAAYASLLVGLVNGELRCSGPVHWRTAVLTVAAAGPPLTKKEKNRPTSRFTYSYSYSQLYSTTIPTYFPYTYSLQLYTTAVLYCTLLILQNCTLLAVDSTLQLVGRALKYIHSMYVYLFALCCCTYMYIVPIMPGYLMLNNF